MKRFLVVLLAVVVIFTTVIPKQEAKADGLTLAAISSCAYAIASASGMDFAFTGFDGLGVGQWMQNRINSWLAGRSIAEAFGSELIRLSAGKLLIPSAAVAGIVEFLGDLKTSYNLQENASSQTTVQTGTINGLNVYTYNGVGTINKPNIPLTPFGYVEGKVSAEVFTETINGSQKTVVRSYDWNGTLSSSYFNCQGYTPLGYFIRAGKAWATSHTVSVYVVAQNGQWFLGGDTQITYYPPQGSTFTGGITAQIPGSYSPPENLNDLQSWEGTVANAPDTNLDQLLDDIFDQSAAGTLDVSGQVVDTPAEPEVTPVPTAAPGDILGGLDTISGQLEGIDNTLTGVQEGVGEAVGQLEGINEGVGSIAEALETPTSSEASSFKYDLTTLFPFCIPFDIYRFVTMFNASPVAPHVQIPFNIPAIGLQYTFDLDFSSFNSVASVLRSVELIAFCVGLAILTSKVIRW